MTYYFEDEVAAMIKDAFTNAKDYDSLYRELYSVLAIIHGNVVGGRDKEQEMFFKLVRNQAIYNSISMAAKLWNEAFGKGDRYGKE